MIFTQNLPDLSVLGRNISCQNAGNYILYYQYAGCLWPGMALVDMVLAYDLFPNIAVPTPVPPFTNMV